MQQNIVKTDDGHVIGTHSWVDGFKPVKCQPRHRLSEKEVEAHAMWIEKHLSSEDALDFIDRWAAGGVALFFVK